MNKNIYYDKYVKVLIKTFIIFIILIKPPIYFSFPHLHGLSLFFLVLIIFMSLFSFLPLI
jgi:hypothetical protein